MNKPQKKATSAGIILLVLLIAFIAFLLNSTQWSTKSPPIDPQVNDQIDQARALQKMGYLEDALVIFEKYALRGHPEAMFYTGKSYSRGWGVKPDLEKARHYFLLAVQYNYIYRAENAYALGRLFQRSEGPDCNRIAVEWFEKALDWGFAKASLQLSMHYERGLGVDRDIPEAIMHYEIAALAGYERALLKYAHILAKGSFGITPDKERAYFLTQQAVTSLIRKARAGSASAAKQLGRLYRDGKLVPADPQKSQEWLLQAAKLGSTGAMHNLAYLMLDGAEKAQEQAEALVWLRKAAAQGHGGAMTALGRFHLKEKYGLEQAGAVGWFKLGVRAGHAGSMVELARLYLKGFLVKKDREEAIRLAERGSRLGHQGSKTLLKELLGTNKA